MAAHRKAFPTPRGNGKSDPKGGVARLPDVVTRRLWCMHTKARRAPSGLYQLNCTHTTALRGFRLVVSIN